MSDQSQPGEVPPDTPQPDPAAPPPSAPDGTAPAASGPAGQPISAQPWSSPSGGPPPPAHAPGPTPVPPAYTPGPTPVPPPPPAYTPGAAPIPPPRPENPPTAQFPQVNYAPPGRAPDYGYQYGPGDYQAPTPPGYPGYPPPARPRRSNVPLIAVIVAVTLLLCGGLATTGVLVAHNISDRAHKAIKPLTEPTLPDLPTDVPNLPDLPTDGGGLGQQIDVTYQVTGDGPAAILYIAKLGDGPTKLEDVKLPWTFTTKMQTPALVSIIAMRSDTGTGRVTCRTLVDGQEVRKATSAASAFATAACTYLALD